MKNGLKKYSFRHFMMIVEKETVRNLQQTH